MALEKKKRPDALQGVSVEIQTADGPMNVTLNFLEDAPFEVFARIAKAGTAYMSMTEAIARLVSLSLRYGIPKSEIVDQLDGVGGKFEIAPTIPDAIATILKGDYETLT